MRYSNMLQAAISNSGLKLYKIAERIEEITGTRPDKAYLSRLQNDKASPASDKLNDALAIVLGVDPLELKVAAYREKIPPEVLKRLNSANSA